MLGFLKQQSFQLLQLLLTLQTITICCSTSLHWCKGCCVNTNDPYADILKSLFFVFKSLLLVLISWQHWMLLAILFLETFMWATYKTVFSWFSPILNHSSFSFSSFSLSDDPCSQGFCCRSPFHTYILSLISSIFMTSITI